MEAESAFAADVLGGAVAGISLADTRQYLRHVADQRLVGVSGTVCFDEAF
ncbi:MAG TPA: hypothetical protein VM142_16305 [Acidimicrobiales bacterium]|nr:hypothetical protein [Acidimicrobiales bacterium]